MNSTQFTYWLKGAFELNESMDINAKQTQVIKNQLRNTDTKEQSSGTVFCTWLKGFFEMVEPEFLTLEQTDKIKTKLKDSFSAIHPTPPVKPRDLLC